LELCRERNIPLIHVSSCEAYGGQGGVLTENSPLKPNSPYASSKAASDVMCYSYWKTYNMNINILRPSNIYGPGQKSGIGGAVIPRFVDNIINNTTEIKNKTENLPIINEILPNLKEINRNANQLKTISKENKQLTETVHSSWYKIFNNFIFWGGLGIAISAAVFMFTRNKIALYGAAASFILIITGILLIKLFGILMPVIYVGITAAALFLIWDSYRKWKATREIIKTVEEIKPSVPNFKEIANKIQSKTTRNVVDENKYIEYKGWITSEMEWKMKEAKEKNNLDLLIVVGNDKRYLNYGITLNELKYGEWDC
jgi:PII-like signaling protein